MDTAILVFAATPILLFGYLLIGETLLESILGSGCVPLVMFLVVWAVISISHLFGYEIGIKPHADVTASVVTETTAPSTQAEVAPAEVTPTSIEDASKND